MFLVDTHCHLNMLNYRDDVDAVIRRSLEVDVAMIVVGTDYKSSKKALELVNRFQTGVSAAVGLHPGSLENQTEECSGQEVLIEGEKYNAESYQLLAKFPKVVAIGEIGLDYFRLPIEPELREAIKYRQKQAFVAQLQLAVSLDRPVIMHCRQAHDDMLDILNEHRKKYRSFMSEDRPWGVMHCFSGDEALAWKYFNLGLAVSFTGLITFSQQWDALIRKMPNDRLMLETDSPFMTPEPYRGKRNEPVLVKHVADRVAEIKGYTLERVARMTTENAVKIFRL